MSERWDDHFLRLCVDTARMSKDPNTRVGAVIVGPDREVRSTGFNGFPRGIADTAERLRDRETKLKLVVHGEMNAVLAAARVGIPVKGCTLYLAATDNTGLVWGGPPCTRCTVEAIQAGIVAVVSRPIKAIPSRWHDDLKLSRALLDEAGISYHEVAPSIDPSIPGDFEAYHFDAATLSATDIEAIRHVAAGCHPAKALADLFANARERQECRDKLARLGLTKEGYLVPRETQQSIGRWAAETFPGGDDLGPRHCIRLLEEVAELCYAAGCYRLQMVTAVRQAGAKLPDQGLGPYRSPESPEAIARELADCEIVLRVLAERRGIDLDAEVDAKMAVNRYQREWIAVGDGTGYHKKNP